MFLFFFNYSINFAKSEYKEHKMLTWKAYSLTFIKHILIGVILSLEIITRSQISWLLILGWQISGLHYKGSSAQSAFPYVSYLPVWDNRYQECDYQLSLLGRAFWSVCARVNFLPHKTIRVSPPYSNQRSYQMMMMMKWNYKEHKKHLNIKWSTANETRLMLQKMINLGDLGN